MSHTPGSGPHDHLHPHEPGGHPGLTRRTVLQGMALGFGAAVTASLVTAQEAVAAGSAVKLPGFSAFASSVKTLKSGQYYLVESNGLPPHNMMVGITNWQQQVPVPQPYSGSNAWQFPVTPKLAANPISAKTNLFRGAIALAADGVPIFNALNNRGEDSYLIGELDEWGGHCGRADDYHYHTAPLHLSKTVGATKPIAYALDGYPMYGSVEPNGTALQPLDEYNGHMFKGKYHYHGTKTYPYANGGMRGVVTVKDGQVDPQPVANPFRPAGEPLRGAKITEFVRNGSSAFALEYTLSGSRYRINYTATLQSVSMTFIAPNGTESTQAYSRKA
ncbi:unannotated protein [freshwater metagenome]|uniref:Unannotated protein n=1 Tax=freshwater metagenome TaxID=449393 RepID=A0A6J7KPP0_9ZZZZ